MDSALHLYALYIFRRERLIFLATRGALLGAKKRSGGRKITIEENPMTSIPVEGASITQPSTSSISPPAQFAGKVLRAIFLICLIIVTLRVALPQSETIWTIYDEPGDVVRFGLGLGVCVWIGVHLFKLPQGSQAFQTWLHFGLAGVPFGILCSVFLWWNHLHTWWHLLHG
jgi:hypothetical protein